MVFLVVTVFLTLFLMTLINFEDSGLIFYMILFIAVCLIFFKIISLELWVQEKRNKVKYHCHSATFRVGLMNADVVGLKGLAQGWYAAPFSNFSFLFFFFLQRKPVETAHIEEKAAFFSFMQSFCIIQQSSAWSFVFFPLHSL